MAAASITSFMFLPTVHTKALVYEDLRIVSPCGDPSGAGVLNLVRTVSEIIKPRRLSKFQS